MSSAKVLSMKNKPDNSKAKDTLKRILKEKSYLRDGDFTLSSGEKSTVFFDVKMTSLDPQGSALAADLILDMLEGENIKAVGGLAIGACPIVSAICVRSYARKQAIGTFYVRKEKKEHGTRKDIEGIDLIKGDKVAIVDDVATKGGSLLDAINKVKAAGCTVSRVIVVVDREQGAKATLAAEGYNLESVFTRSDLE